MNILIAESGSTKTDWCLIQDGHPDLRLQTDGLNPWIISVDKIEQILVKELEPYFNFNQIDEFYFYGAGLGASSNCDKLNDLLSDLFATAEIELNTDILGVARAAFVDEKGIACILGTGSNACLYDGKSIIFQVPSLGYLIGDEGSGSYLGKLLLKARFEQMLPATIQEKFEKQYNIDLPVALERIYRQPQPNIFLSGFCPFIAENINDPFIHSLVSKAFGDFFKSIVARIPQSHNHSLILGGSVAWYFREILIEVALSLDYSIKKIIQSPIEGLIEYHKKNPEVVGLLFPGFFHD